jgi:hypothetical protein
MQKGGETELKRNPWEVSRFAGTHFHDTQSRNWIFFWPRTDNKKDTGQLSELFVHALLARIAECCCRACGWSSAMQMMTHEGQQTWQLVSPARNWICPSSDRVLKKMGARTIEEHVQKRGHAVMEHETTRNACEKCNFSGTASESLLWWEINHCSNDAKAAVRASSAHARLALASMGRAMFGPVFLRLLLFAQQRARNLALATIVRFLFLSRRPRAVGQQGLQSVHFDKWIEWPEAALHATITHPRSS